MQVFSHLELASGSGYQVAAGETLVLSLKRERRQLTLSQRLRVQMTFEVLRILPRHPHAAASCQWSAVS